MKTGLEGALDGLENIASFEKTKQMSEGVCLLLGIALAVVLNLPDRMLKFSSRHMDLTRQHWMARTLILLIPLLCRAG